MTRWIGLLSAACTAALITPAWAQPSDNDVAAYFAMILTPVGALPPLEVGSRLGETTPGAISLRYGRMSEEEDALNNVAASVDFNAGRGRMSVTGGALTCSGCDPIVMVGLELTSPLYRRALSDGSWSLGLTTGVGAGIPTGDGGDSKAVSLALSLPATLIVGPRDGVRIVPFLVPGVGFGIITGAGGESGIRPTIGAGVGVRGGGFEVTVGLQKVVIDEGDTVIGLGLTFGAR